MRTTIIFFMACFFSAGVFAQQQASKKYSFKNNDFTKAKEQRIVKAKYVQAEMYKNSPVIERDTMIIINREKRETYSIYKYQK